GGPWARRPLHLARDAAPAGDVGLPAAVGADAVLHELLRHVERAGRVRRVRELRGDPDVPGGPPASADDAGLRGRGRHAPDRPGLRHRVPHLAAGARAGSADHRLPGTDDAVAGRGGPVLAVHARRAVRRREQPAHLGRAAAGGVAHPAGDGDDLADRRRHLAVDAVHHAHRPGRPHRGAALPVRGGVHRPGVGVVPLPQHHAAARVAAAAHRRDVPRHRGVPAVRPRLHPHQRRTGGLDRDVVVPRLQGGVPRLQHRAGVGVRDPHGRRRHRPRADLPALPQQAQGGLMAGSLVARARPARSSPRSGPRGRVRKTVELALLAVLVVAMLFPVLWMLETSVKENRDVYAVPAKLVGFDLPLAHYRDVFVGPSGGASDLSVALLNSVVVAGASTILATVLGVPAAWAYSRFTLRAKKDQLFFILSTRFMPPVVVVIPIFLMYRTLGLIDSQLGLILIYTAFNVPFTIWMMKGFVDQVPSEYEDAAMLDGHTRFQAFRRITLPLLLPGIAATAVFALIFSWNEFVYAIFLTSSREVRTAPPAIAGLIGGTTVDWGLVAASACVFAVPVLVFAYLVRKHLVAGVTLGAVRR